ncbi:hypothetical protein GCM10027615_26740 [Plantactinospora veratri]
MADPVGVPGVGDSEGTEIDSWCWFESVGMTTSRGAAPTGCNPDGAAQRVPLSTLANRLICPVSPIGPGRPSSPG